jgi:hypothetical protein
MINRLWILIILFSIFSLQGQNNVLPTDSTNKNNADTTINAFKPTVGLGIGMLKFYGDITDGHYGNPFVSRLGYELFVSQDITSYLNLKFYVLFGQLAGNEHSYERHLNFQSHITTGGFLFRYNFLNFLDKNRTIYPHIDLGIESIEFLSKTDLYDANGNKYYYWSDGSIRNMAENDPNASQALLLERDYNYETDMRELNADGYGKYPERTFAIPFGIGFDMPLTEHWLFNFNATYHYTFTDLIDNVTAESKGDRMGSKPGNKSNDKFLQTSVSLNYNFGSNYKEKEPVEDLENIDYLAFDQEDEDGDGIIDWLDKCPWTPPGVEVDENGCPLDKDKDFVADFKDDEVPSPDSAIVDMKGVAMSDSLIYLKYLMYMDSTGQFADIVSSMYGEYNIKKKKHYKIKIGSFTEGISDELVAQFLSIPDVEFHNFGDTITVITVGDYNNLPEAIKRKISLIENGIDPAIIVEQKKDGTLISVGDEANNLAVENSTTTQSSNNTNSSAGENTEVSPIGQVVFRIQLGAFSKRIPSNKFYKVNNVIEYIGDDGLYKYTTGSFTDFNQAAKHKLNMALKGYKDAFIVAFKDGKRISLKEAGVETTAEENIAQVTEEKINPENVFYTVQIGLYKNELPTEVLTKFMELDNIEQTELEEGLTRYTTGKFKSLQEAENYKNSLIQKGFTGAFIIALHNGNVIAVSKAKEILGK